MAGSTSLNRLVSEGRGRGGGGGVRGQGRVVGGACSSPATISVRPGVGAPRAAGPSEGLLGPAAPGGVRGSPHGSGRLEGRGALLDRIWAGPVRPGGGGWAGPDGGVGGTGRGGSLRGCSARRYLSPVVGLSPSEQLDNPELNKEDTNINLQARRRRLQLRAATTRMRLAALGRDLELEDWGENPGRPERCAPPGFLRSDPAPSTAF